MTNERIIYILKEMAKGFEKSKPAVKNIKYRYNLLNSLKKLEIRSITLFDKIIDKVYKVTIEEVDTKL